jgi:hypothetical protein
MLEHGEFDQVNERDLENPWLQPRDALVEQQSAGGTYKERYRNSQGGWGNIA